MDAMDVARKQAALACDFCHRRKVACDRVRPQCGRCREENIQCKSSRAPRLRGRHHVTRFDTNYDGIENRLARLENILRQQNTQERRSSSNVVSNEQHTLNQQLTLNAPGSVKIQFVSSSINGALPICAPQSYRGQPCASDILRTLNPETELIPIWEDFGIIKTQSDHERARLPNKKLVEDCARLYYSSPLSVAFPILDNDTLSDTIELAYGEKRPTRPTHVENARACIFSFLALMCICRPQLQAKSSIDARSISRESSRLIVENLERAPTLDGLQAIITQALFSLFSGAFDSVEVLVGYASRCVFSLDVYACNINNGVLSGAAPFTLSEKLRLRTLFWIGYRLDTDMSLRSGRPPYFVDDEFDLTLPANPLHSSPSDSMSAFDVNLDCSSALLISQAKLSIIKSKTYKLLYSRRAKQKSDIEIIQHIREIDEDLETWRQSLPVQYRPTLFFRGKIPETNHHATCAVSYMLEYYYCLAAIHQACRRCTQATQTRSSLDLSVEASRSMLLFLYSPQNDIARECFRYLLCHFAAALSTLFSHLMEVPLASSSKEDLNLLVGLPARFREVLTDQMPLHGGAFMDSVENSLSLMAVFAQNTIHASQQTHLVIGM